MSQITQFTFNSKSAADTADFAKLLGSQLKGGEVIELIGDVGAGKTTFVRGLAEGTGSKDIVSSPTFTIYNTYEGEYCLYHYDLYRLHDDALIKNELSELLEEPKNIIVLEWAEELRTVLPENFMSITFSTTDEEARTLQVKIPASYNYLELS